MSRRPQTLPISERFRLPLDFIADTNLVLGTKGSGKSYFGMKLVEGMFDVKTQVVIIDITGVWWGLTSSADGKNPGLPIFVFGGSHAHAPLEPTAGELLANWTVESGQSLILDASLMRKGEAHRFCADYLENLYRLKASHRESMHLMMDEANRLAPMRPGKDQLRVLGASEDIVLQGRSRGLGLTMLTQRPAILHNDLRSQSQAIITLRIPGPHDQRAVKEWLDIHATPEQGAIVMNNLAKLTRGEAFYFSTSGTTDDPLRFTIAPRWTFDSSYTPKPGERVRTVKKRSEVDLAKLSDQIRQTAEAAEANKPERLRARIRELEGAIERGKISVAQAARDNTAKPGKIKEIKVPDPKLAKHLRNLITAIDQRIQQAKTLGEKIDGLQQRLTFDLSEITRGKETIQAYLAKFTSEPEPPLIHMIKRGEAGPVMNVGDRYAIIDEPPTNGDQSRDGDKKNKGLRAVMRAIATAGVVDERPFITVLTGYKRRTRDQYIYLLSKQGFATVDDDGIRPTPAGLRWLGDFKPLPKPGPELRAHWYQKLPAGLVAILKLLVERYPRAVPRGDIRDTLKMKERTCNQYIYLLNKLSLIVATRKDATASERLFDLNERVPTGRGINAA